MKLGARLRAARNPGQQSGHQSSQQAGRPSPQQSGAAFPGAPGSHGPTAVPGPEATGGPGLPTGSVAPGGSMASADSTAPAGPGTLTGPGALFDPASATGPSTANSPTAVSPTSGPPTTGPYSAGPYAAGPFTADDPTGAGAFSWEAEADVVTLEDDSALTALKDKASALLFERLGTRLLDASLDEDQLHRMVQDELSAVVQEEDIPLTRDERLRLIRGVKDDVLGYGPLQPLLEDPEVTEIMVNGPDMVYVERDGRLSRSAARFGSEEQLRQVIERIVTRVGRRVDESSPLVDARLEDGSRVHAVIPPLAVNGSSLSIRKFSRDPFKVQDLIRFGTLTPAMAELLRACVRARLNIVISGGTGTGKTTLLNVLSSFIPHGERIITIEDAVELQLQQAHVVRLESRPPNIEGRGEISIRELVRNSLRMRPDRIVVGEVRGGETLDMLQAMNTGHDGSLSTVHANSPRDAVSRLETLVLMAGMDLPLRAIREQVTSAVDLIVQITRMRDGTRRVTQVTEVQGMEGDVVTLQDAFVFDYAAGVDADGRFRGVPVSTGVRPKFTERMADLGIELPAELFNPGHHAGLRNTVPGTPGVRS